MSKAERFICMAPLSLIVIMVLILLALSAWATIDKSQHEPTPCVELQAKSL